MLEWLTEPRKTLCLQVYWGFVDGTVAKNPPVNAGDARDLGSVPGLCLRVPVRSPRELMTPSDSKHVSMDLIWTLSVCGATAGLAWAFLVQ